MEKFESEHPDRGETFQGSVPAQAPPPLQLLLFVDDRYKTREEIRKIHDVLSQLAGSYGYGIQEINVASQPHLTEYYKVIATPTLIRTYPGPRHVLAGTDIAIQLEHWWPSWQELIDGMLVQQNNSERAPTSMASTPVEQLRLEDEVFRLQQENENLKSQLQFKDRIITVLAHDLRSPLTAAFLAIDTLYTNLQQQSRGEGQPLKPELVNQLLSQGRRQMNIIDHMVTELLEGARQSNRNFLIQPHKVDLKSLCDETISQIEEQWRAKQQTIAMDIPSDLPWVYIDKERIQQVLLNLLGNAIKYTPTGGIIQLAALHRTSQKIQVSVCDNGPGIPEKEQERIFEDSFRLERDAEADGYGIGLGLCQKIVQAHYGKIWVDSTSSQGSCFHFILPVYPYPKD